MTLASDEFIRRFLIHVLPAGFHRIRHYGLFAKTAGADNIARGTHTSTAPMPVMIDRSGKWPWRTRRWRPSPVQFVGMSRKEACHFGFDRLNEQRSGAVAENLRQSIGEGSWLNQRKTVSVGHGVSLLRWRSGGLKHPHDTPPYPSMPSPTFANSSTRPGQSRSVEIDPGGGHGRGAQRAASVPKSGSLRCANLSLNQSLARNGLH